MEKTKNPSAEFALKKLKEFITIPKEYEGDILDSADSKESLSQNLVSICLLGVTGHGKSSTANTLSGKQHFVVSDSIESETKTVNGLITAWTEDSLKNKKILVLDTPGFGDSKGQDTAHIANIVNQLKIIGYVHTFILILNSEDPRFDEQLQSTLRIISQIFGSEFFGNLLLCFTKYTVDKRSERERSMGRKCSKDKLKSEYQTRFREEFAYSLEADQFVFINNGVDQYEDVEVLELNEHMNAIKEIHNFTTARIRAPFYCNDIKEVLKENDELKRKIQELNELAELERKQYIYDHEQKLKEILENEKEEAERREARIRQENFQKEEELRQEQARKEELLKEELIKKEEELKKEIAWREEMMRRQKEEKEAEMRRQQERNNNDFLLRYLLLSRFKY